MGRTRVYLIEHEPEARKLSSPDVAISEGDQPAEPARQSAGTATLEAVTIPMTILEGPRETYIEILYQPERRLVTSLELLSPANKQQPGRTEYPGETPGPDLPGCKSDRTRFAVGWKTTAVRKTPPSGRRLLLALAPRPATRLPGLLLEAATAVAHTAGPVARARRGYLHRFGRRVCDGLRPRPFRPSPTLSTSLARLSAGAMAILGRRHAWGARDLRS